MPSSLVMNRTHVVVAASVAATSQQAGWSWAVLQYLVGFQQLGCRVTFVDVLDARTRAAMPAPLHESPFAAWFLDIVSKYGMSDGAALLAAGSHDTVGLSYRELRDLVRSADVLLNVSGRLRDEELLGDARRAVYLDVDPAFTQLWQHVQGIDMGLAGHHRFVTVGPLIGDGHVVPSLGQEWIPTLPPVVLSHWPVATELVYDALTTVANWRGYGSIEYQGTLFGQKVHTLRALMALPQKTTERFVLALGIDPGETRDVAALADHGWTVIDPVTVTGTLDGYQRFVRGSKAEFGIAKSGYVLSQCGWISDRSVCYLASGRPVIAQDTGFGRLVPTGEGLFRFTAEDDVLRAIDEMNRDYAAHARAARALAEEYFDARRVLARLLERVAA